MGPTKRNIRLENFYLLDFQIEYFHFIAIIFGILEYDKLLGHPNVVAFISHCGLMSTYEAIYYAKPMITVPIFADQPSTAARLQELGVGVHMDIMDTKKEEFIMLLDEVVNKTKYVNTLQLCNLNYQLFDRH